MLMKYYIYDMKDIDIWQDMQRQALATKTEGLTEPEMKAYGYDFVFGAIGKVPARPQTDAEMEVFKLKTETLIALLPTTAQKLKKLDKGPAVALSNYKSFLIKKYNVISKGYYTSIWMSLGIAIGVSFGVALKNIALGIPVGIGIGLAIGGGLQRKAEKEGRVI